jgi:hypothetical protein
MDHEQVHAELMKVLGVRAILTAHITTAQFDQPLGL